jgi:hypothetical protein
VELNRRWEATLMPGQGGTRGPGFPFSGKDSFHHSVYLTPSIFLHILTPSITPCILLLHALISCFLNVACSWACSSWGWILHGSYHGHSFTTSSLGRFSTSRHPV